MKSYLVYTPALIRRLYGRRIWRGPEQNDSIYLTFDDGPIPEVTPWVLDRLKEAKAKATFFVIGDNVHKHPEVLNRVIDEGHALGNHTFHHLKQPTVSAKNYLEDVDRCKAQLLQHSINTLLFRPPYGKLSARMAKAIRSKGLKIVMWDVLSADFDTSIDGAQCTKNVLDNISPGSIVVFHDSLKAQERLKRSLPQVLKFIENKGWKCRALA